MYLTGLNNDWTTLIKMEYNAYKVRFYADIEAASDTEIKFLTDLDWTYNWGVDCVKDGGNIPVEAGNYRVYLDLNKNEITFNAKMYGKEEPTEPAATEPEDPEEPEEPTTVVKQGLWSIVGNNGDWDTDIYMTAGENGLWWSDAVTLTSTFKLRYNCNYDIERGGSFTAVDVPFSVEQKGADISVPEGTYYVVYDEINSEITVKSVNGWRINGDINGHFWDADVPMYEVDGVYKSIPFTVTANSDGFKIRQDDAWAVSAGGTFTDWGEAFDAVLDNGANIKPGYDGVVVVTYDTTSEKITVEKFYDDRWSVIGDINGQYWDLDVPMFVVDGVWKSAPFYAAAESEGFKIRKDADWADGRYGEFVSLGESFPALSGGNNITGATGYLYLVYDSSAETITINEYK